MQLFDYETILPFAVDTVFQHTVDLENAPTWHPYFYHVEQTTSGAIGRGTKWRNDYRYMGMSGALYLEIVEWERNHLVRFEGSRMVGIVPQFLIKFKPVEGGTHVHYFLQPTIPRFMQIPMSIVGPIAGRRDLRQYFHELEQQLSLVAV